MLNTLNGWKLNPAGVREAARRNGTFTSVARSLLGGEQKDVFLWRPLLKVKPTWRRGSQGIGDCYAAGTHVLGPDGVKRIENVVVGDRVYAGDGSITTVITTQTKQSFKQLLTIETCGGIPLTVTEDHKVLAYRFSYADNRTSGRHKRLSKGLYEHTKARQLHSKENSKWQLDRPNSVIAEFEGREAVLVEAKELRTSDYLLCPVKTQFDTNIPEAFTALMSNAETRWLIGLFLGDGHTSSGSLEFACTTDEPEIQEKLIKVLATLGVTATVTPHSQSEKGVKVEWRGCPLAKAFREAFYDSNKQKILPSWAICDDVVAGLRDADGHQDASANILYFDSTSPSLAHGVRLWAINAGYCPTMKEVVRSKGSYDNAKPLYRVRWQLSRTRERLWRDDNYLSFPITKITSKEGPHTVYDIGVKHDMHTFYANGVVATNCVSWGTEIAVTTLMATADAAGTGQFIAEAATEPFYGGSRVEALGKRSGGFSDGAMGYASAEFSNKWGVVLRLDYSKETGNPEHDLRKYNKDKAKQWGNYGCGGKNDNGKLDAIAKEHPVVTIAQAKTIPEVIAALTNGYTVTIASNAGFGAMRRDADGVCRWVDSWGHQMCLWGLRWFKGKPQFRICQSWGDSCSGDDPGIEETLTSVWARQQVFGANYAQKQNSFVKPILPYAEFPYVSELSVAKWNPISACSWWAVESDIARILSTGDCWIYSDVQGFVKRDLDILGAAQSWY